MNSIWLETSEKPRFNSLEGDHKTDVLIVGGGISGILCAYMMEKSGLDYILVEADEICSGITKNTTAKITSQHGLIYSKIQKEYGIEAAGLYYEINERAIDIFRRISKTVDCDFTEVDSYVYSKNDIGKLHDEMQALSEIGAYAEFVGQINIPIDAVGAIKFMRQAQFHPLKFLYSIAKDLNIYEHTKVTELKPGSAKTDRGRIFAEKVIVATHFPILNKHGSYFLKMYQSRSYVLAVENASDVRGFYVDENEKGFSFRNHNENLIIGGGDHRTGKNGEGWKELEQFVKVNFPRADIKYRFATQDCMTLDGIPYIGQYSRRTENLYVSTGFNKWGMTSSMVGAILLSDMVQGKSNKYCDVFSPSRTILHPQLAINAFETVKNLLTPTAPRCPHLGCALVYNPFEHSWDCPCHGSRFTEDGKLIDNPATDDKKHSL